VKKVIHYVKHHSKGHPSQSHPIQILKDKKEKIGEKHKMKTIDGFDKWVDKFGEADSKLNLWREAMSQLRQLHGDVWNGVRFFLTVNGIIIAALFAVVTCYLTSEASVKVYMLMGTVGIVAVGGLLLTIIAVKILKKHRTYYLNMLLVKTLLEKELGFYEINYQGIELAFPWKIDKEFNDIELQRPDRWLIRQMWRSGTISRLLWLTYWSFIVLYAAMIIGSVMCIICL
jgi:hypothetical protein